MRKKRRRFYALRVRRDHSAFCFPEPLSGQKSTKPASCARYRSSLTGTRFSRSIASATASADSSSRDRKSTRLNSSHTVISYAVFCLKKKKSIMVKRLVLQFVYFPAGHV